MFINYYMMYLMTFENYKRYMLFKRFIYCIHSNHIPKPVPASILNDSGH